MFDTFIIMLLAALLLAGCSEKTGEQLYRDGLGLLEKNPNGAIVIFKSALVKNQNLVEARCQLARAYIVTGQLESAEKELQKAIRLGPGRLELHLELARLYNRMRLPDRALDAVATYRKSHPHSSDAMEAAGVAYGLKNMPRQAENLLVRALLQDHDRTGTALRLAELYASQKKLEQARSLLADVISGDRRHVEAHRILADLELNAGRKREALALYRRLESLERDNPEAPYRAGLLCLDLGDEQGASSRAAALVKDFSDRGEGHLLKGIIAFRMGKYHESISSFRTAQRLTPTVSGSYLLGLALNSGGEPEHALSQFRTVLDAVPDFHQARLLSGMLLFRLKRYDESIAELRRLTQADQRNALAHNILGSAYLAQGNYDEGIRELNRAAACDPKLLDTYLKKGIIYLRLGRSADVERELKTAVRIAPGLAGTRLILASFYLQRHNPDKAFQTLKSGLNGKPGDALLYATMARIRFNQAMPREAVGYLHMATAADPGASAPRFALASHYAGIGDTTRAIGEYRTILERHPRNLKAMLGISDLLNSGSRRGEADAWLQALRPMKTVDSCLALVDSCAGEGGHGDALALLQKASAFMPRSGSLLDAKVLTPVSATQSPGASQAVGELKMAEASAGAPRRDVLRRDQGAVAPCGTRLTDLVIP